MSRIILGWYFIAMSVLSGGIAGPPMIQFGPFVSAQQCVSTRDWVTAGKMVTGSNCWEAP